MLDEEYTEYFDVGGALVYDPCIGQFDAQDDMYTLPFIEQNNSVLSYNQSFLDKMTELDTECGFADFREEYMQFPPSGQQPPLETPDGNCTLWSTAYYAAYAPNPCFNVYELGLQCPLLSDPLGYPTDLQYSYPGLPVHFNRTDVKKAMHAPMEIEWLECAPHQVFVGKGEGPYSDAAPGSGGPEGYEGKYTDGHESGSDSNMHCREFWRRPIACFANGAPDMDILPNATLLAIQDMTWNGQMGFQSPPYKHIIIDLPDLQYESVFESSGSDALSAHRGVMGKQHYERGLMFAESYLSGHMEPQLQPRSAYGHLQCVLGRVEEL